MPSRHVHLQKEHIVSLSDLPPLRHPQQRPLLALQCMTVSLAPADLPKEEPAYDLPIAVGVLAVSEQIWPEALERAMFTLSK